LSDHLEQEVLEFGDLQSAFPDLGRQDLEFAELGLDDLPRLRGALR
jgi:hypothetical protein